MAQAKQKKSIPVGPVKCEVCTKTVFQMEQVTIDGHVMHDKCFKCAQCGKKLAVGTCSSIYDKFYCKPHFMALFTSKGNYNEGFGEQKDQLKFNAAHGHEGHEAAAPAAAPASTPAAKPAEATKPAAAAKPAEVKAAAPAATPAAKPAEATKPAAAVKAATPAAKPAEATKPAAVVKEPHQAYNDKTKKHTIENYSDNSTLVLTAQSPADGVFVSGCKSCMLTVTGKLSTIQVLNCVDCAFIFDDIIASVEVNRSKKTQLQANGQLPQILVDGSEGGTFHLSEHAQGTQIICSLSESINVVIPQPEDDLELPVPYQFVSKFVDGKLVTNPADHV